MTVSTTVVNIHDANCPVDVLYCGRGSMWGNPFIIGKNGNRDEVCEKFKSYLFGTRSLLAQIGSIKGKTLGCHCKPKRCHLDLLKELAENGAWDLL